MNDEEKFKNFFKKMEEGINEHKQMYKDSWRDRNNDFIRERLKQKQIEYELTLNPDKLISIANLAMLLYVKLTED